VVETIKVLMDKTGNPQVQEEKAAAGAGFTIEERYASFAPTRTLLWIIKILKD